jgi:predicted transcriptional regulator
MYAAVVLELGKREREIMEAVYRLGRAGVREVLDELPDPPSYSSVRAMLGILEGKGLLRHVQEGRRYVYRPARPKNQAQRTTLRRIVSGLFGGSVRDAMHTLIELDGERMSDEELDDLMARIERVRQARTRSAE